MQDTTTTMRSVTDLRAAVVGTGFVGVVHVDALRRLGVEVVGVVGSSAERAAEKARAAGLPPAYASFDEALADERVDIVHLATPNHLHREQVLRCLDAGKHVVCEKPLAISSAESAELLARAEASGLVHCTNYNLRFYPLLHHARALARMGGLGRVLAIHGAYLQDWLLHDTDWNWRLEPELGGELRAVADIGTHWLDLAAFVSGLGVEAVFADLGTVHPVRRRPAGPVETFAGAADVEREDVEVRTDDLAHVLLRFAGGVRGAVVISQVAAGRKNALRLEVDGEQGSVAWDSERPEELVLGHRDRPNELLLRNPALMAPDAARRTALPAGHGEGYADTFRELYRSVYAAVAAGGPPAEPDYPTFRDGHVELVLAEAIAESSRERRWIEVTDA